MIMIATMITTTVVGMITIMGKINTMIEIMNRTMPVTMIMTMEKKMILTLTTITIMASS